jgi:hypothetical protein
MAYALDTKDQEAPSPLRGVEPEMQGAHDRAASCPVRGSLSCWFESGGSSRWQDLDAEHMIVLRTELALTQIASVACG